FNILILVHIRCVFSFVPCHGPRGLQYPPVSANQKASSGNGIRRKALGSEEEVAKLAKTLSQKDGDLYFGDGAAPEAAAEPGP
ncbi:unnamed protein product, partial [Heterosigma akashiwo]